MFHKPTLAGFCWFLGHIKVTMNKLVSFITTWISCANSDSTREICRFRKIANEYLRSLENIVLMNRKASNVDRNKYITHYKMYQYLLLCLYKFPLYLIWFSFSFKPFNSFLYIKNSRPINFLEAKWIEWEYRESRVVLVRSWRFFFKE